MRNITCDISIIGAGPSGLCAAWYLSKHYDVIIIDHQGIGGCHRVEYEDITEDDAVISINDMPIEHGPRVYSEAFVNARKWLNDMGINMMDYMKPYKSGFLAIAKKMGSNLSVMDFVKLTGHFFMFLFGYNNNNPLMDMNLSEEGQIFMDKFCRLTDGAAADTYPIYKFMELINQHPMSNMLIPNKSMDHLWDIVKQKLISRGVRFFDDKITAVNISDTMCMGKNNYLSTKIMLAIPPKNLLDFPNVMELFDISEQWIKDHGYIWYDSYQIIIPYKVNNSDWGLLNDPNGLVWINMSDYWDIDYTYISAALTDVPDIPAEERKEYVKKTIADYMNVPINDIIIKNGLSMPSFVEHHEYKTYPSCRNGNIFLLGTHTGLSKYAFTSMESAVESTMKCIKKIIPETLYIKSRITLRHILVFIIVIVILLIAIHYNISSHLYRQ